MNDCVLHENRKPTGPFLLADSTMDVERRNTPFDVVPGVTVTLDDIFDVAVHHRPVTLSPAVLALLEQGRAQLEKKLAAGKVIYGINTGFGGNANLVISNEQLAHHQTNLLTFLSAGTGERFSEDYVRAAQFMTLLALVRGWSAIRAEVAMTLLNHLNHRIVPNVPRHGSVGASGDLIPSSYIGGALCGRGTVRFGGQEMTAKEALTQTGIPALRLQAKEGLALVNGTRMMTGLGALTIRRFKMTFQAAVGVLALTVEAMRASHEHYDARIHAVKGHPGQIAVAKALREMLANSRKGNPCDADVAQPYVVNRTDTVVELDECVQEIYSIRCAPQVLGVVPESLDAARRVLEREAVSANDNPLIDPRTGDVLHGGNFMGQHVARAMDALKIDMVIVANHMHAIMALLMDSRFSRGLPNSLSPRLGLYQGFKGVQISQTALVAHLRRESAPASVHSLPTEQFNQDIVSLGLHAALGAAEMESKLRDVVSMTLLAACQAIDLRGNASELAEGTNVMFRAVRQVSPALDEDRPMDCDIASLSNAIVDGTLPLPSIKLLTAADGA